MKISIIIPAYNAEKFIVESLDSIVYQENGNWEIIIINDGSKDRTQEVCEEYILKHPYANIKLISQENAGVSVARNRGMDEATGEWLTFLDADDLLEQSLIKKLNLVDFSSIDVILCEYVRQKTNIDPVEYKVSALDANLLLRCALRYPKYCKLLQEKYNIDPYSNWTCWAKLYRREWLIKHNVRFPEGVFTSEDFAFLVQVFHNAPRVIGTDILMYVYRDNNQSVTHSFNPNLLKNYNTIFDFLIEYLADSPYHEDLDAYVAARIAECMKILHRELDKDTIYDYVIPPLTKYKRNIVCSPFRDMFVGKKNRIFGTFYLLKMRHLCRKSNNEDITG